MTSKSLVLAAAALLALCSNSSFALSEQQDCDAIANAAANAKSAEVSRLSTIESAVKDQLVNARSCLTTFGDLASRQTVVLGGFDVAPIRDAVFQNACSIIQGKVDQAKSSVNQVYSTATHSATNAITSGISNGTLSNMAGAATRAATAGTNSVWDRLTNWMSGQ